MTLDDLINKERALEVKHELEKDTYEHETEFVYRAYHGSYKIDHLRHRAISKLSACLYILGLVNKSYDDWDEAETAIRKCIKNKTLTYKIFNELITNDYRRIQDKQAQKKGKIVHWYQTDKWVTPYAGYYMFFDNILKCILEYAEKGKSTGGFLEYYDGVVRYFCSDLKFKEEISFWKDLYM